MRAYLLLLLSLSGCLFSPNYGNGTASCAADNVCPSGYGCVDGKCWKGGVSLKKQGDACDGAGTCGPGLTCVDGYCCSSACDGACQACDVTPGTCTTTTTPHGSRSCDGSGVCGGTCDGQSPTCSYPAKGLLCGAACDGQCDGAGSCSSTSGAGCANGYACSGPGACKTSCTMDSDCQTNFQCSAYQTCQRVPESDCLDGLDNNGDGLADCEDPSCVAQVTCVDGATSIGVFATSSASGYSAGPTPLYSSFFDNTACSGCTCASSVTCGAQVGVNSCIPNYVNIAGDFSCQLVDNSGSITAANVGNTVVTGRSCTQSGTPVRVSSPGFNTTSSYWGLSRSPQATCASPTQVCVPRPPMGNQTCTTGLSACSGQFNVTKGQYYSDNKVNVGLCPASCPNSGCTPGGYGCVLNEAYVYSDSNCVNVIDSEVTHTYTCQYPFGPFTVLYSRVSASPTGSEGCSASTPSASPSVPASNPLTVCCNPSEMFNLVNLNSDKCLDVTSGSTTSGTKLQQLSCASGDDNQAWSLSVSGSALVLSAKVSGLCLAGSGSAAGTQVEEDTCDQSAGQQWHLRYVGKLPDTDGKSYDYYEVTSPDSTSSMEVAGASSMDGAAVQTATPSGNANQRWKLVPLQ